VIAFTDKNGIDCDESHNLMCPGVLPFLGAKTARGLIPQRE